MSVSNPIGAATGPASPIGEAAEPGPASAVRSAEYFEQYYHTYWTEAGAFPRGAVTPILRELLEAYVPKGAACLDVGCGDGAGAGSWLRDHGMAYVGVDVSASAIGEATSIGLDARQIDDASVLPFEGDRFDVALCLEVFEHLLAPHLAAAEILRTLKPGGVLLATVPNVAYWRRRVDLALIGRWHPLGDALSVEEPWRDPHLRFFNPGALRRMLGRAGFAVERVGGCNGMFVGDIPWVSKVWPARRGSWLYRRLERRVPSLLGYGLYAVARKPARGR